MNFIQQGYTGKLGLWKYLIVSIFFFGFMALNLLAIFLLDFDMDQIMKDQIAQKGTNLVLIENLVPFAIGLGGLFFWVKYVHNQRIRTLTTSRKKVDWKRVFFAFSLWGFITVLFVFIDYKSSPQDYIINFQLKPFLYLLLIGVLLIPLQTSFEEYFFRGYLMQGLGIAVNNRWIPLIVTSVVFGLLHIANPEVEKLGYEILVYYIGTGFFLGILTLMDEGLELAIGFHAANNLITALLVTANWTAFQTDSILIDISTPSLGADVYVPIFIVFPILLFVFSKKYGWINWKEKLTGIVNDKSRIRYSWWSFDDEYISGSQYLGRSIIGVLLCIIIVGFYLQAVTAYKRSKSLGNSTSTNNFFGIWGGVSGVIGFTPAAPLNIIPHWYLWFSNGRNPNRRN